MDLLWTVASLCAPRPTGDPTLARRMIALVLDGLRAGRLLAEHRPAL